MANSPQWRRVLSLCDKTQFNSITRISGRLSDRNVEPETVDDDAIRALQNAFLLEKRPDATAQINSAIRHMRAVSTKHNLGLPKLTDLPSPRRERKALVNSLHKRLRDETDTFLDAQNVGASTKVDMKNDIYRAAFALRDKNIVVTCLADLIQKDAVKAITRAFGPIHFPSRTRTRTLDTIAIVAEHLGGASANAEIRKKSIAKTKAPLPEVSAQTIRATAPFHDRDYLEAFYDRLLARIVIPAETLTERQLYDAQGAMFALFAVRMILRPEIITAFAFEGDNRATSFGQRFRLTDREYKLDFELLLTDEMVRVLDLYHARLASHLERPPVGPFVDMNGKPRDEVVILHSVDALLAEMGFVGDKNLTPLDLRDLGIRVMLQDKILTVAQIAAIAFYNRANFERRYQPWIRAFS